MLEAIAFNYSYDYIFIIMAGIILIELNDWTNKRW